MASTVEPSFVPATAFPHLSFERRQLEVPRFTRPTEIKVAARPVRSLAWNADGTRAAVGTEYKGVRVYSVKSNGEIDSSTSLPSSSSASNPHNGHISAVAFSPSDPDILISGCKSGTAGGVVCVWDVKHPSAPVATFHFPLDVLSLSWHPSGAHFAATITKGITGIDEVMFFRHTGASDSHADEAGASGKWEKRTDIGLGGSGGAGTGEGGMAEEINSLQFIHSGKACIAASNDGSLNLWAYPVDLQAPAVTPADVESSQLGDAKADDILPDQDMPSAAGAGGSADVSGTPGEAEEPAQAGPSSPHARSHVSRSRSRSRSRSHTPEAHPSNEEAEPATLTDEENEVGTEIAAEVSEVQITVDEPSEDQDPEAAPATATAVPAVSGEMDVDIIEIEPPSPAPSRPVSPGPSTPRSAAQAGHSRTPGAPGGSSKAKGPVPEARQLRRVRRRVMHSASLLAIAQDPAGKYIAVGGHDAMVSLMTTRDWIVVRTFDVFTAAIRHLAFSPSSEVLAVGGDDAHILLLSVYTGQVFARLPTGGSSVLSMAWHPGPTPTPKPEDLAPTLRESTEGRERETKETKATRDTEEIREGRQSKAYREELAWCAFPIPGQGQGRGAVLGRSGQGAGGSWWVAMQEGEKGK